VKTSYITIIVTFLLSTNALSKIEYYHCKGGIDTYWKFDIYAINDISPDAGYGVRKRSMGEVQELTNVKMSKDWFKVVWTYQGMELQWFISRTGKNSSHRQDNPLFGLIKRDMGVCQGIKNEDLDTLFLMQSELQEKDRLMKLELNTHKPPSKNWN
jgi:hypothetical protein